ncbi:MAG TPA: sigma 54-interacting transcriptional regulator [Methylophilus sp.]
MTTASILIVDDDPDILRLLTMRLESAGYKTLLANDGMEALSKVHLERPDLVISDLRMPSLDGLGLMEHLQADHPTLPFIMLTAHGSIAEAVEATQRGAFGFLAKPFDSQALLQQVANALRLSGLPKLQMQAHADDAWRAAILTRSPKMESLLGQAKLIAANDVSVLIQGESGTGKELLAQALHQASPRSQHAFVAINCGAIPENLLESELFGHSKGAFTGATNSHVGLFQSADGGTLFLDEIGDMPLTLQVKVLRALQERVIRPVGSTQQIAINVRLISATHRDLAAEMQANHFREDLFYRINVVRLALPPLRERKEDISLLANYFLSTFAEKHRKTLQGYAPDALACLIQAPWPGNIRQLQNVVEQTVVLATASIIPISLVQKALNLAQDTILPFDLARQQFEHQYLTSLLKSTQGNVAEAAKLAQRNRTEFYRLLERHHIQASSFKKSP